MSIHGTPNTVAEKFAEFLERNYGLQLDPARHKVLCAQVEEFISANADDVRALLPTQKKGK